MPLACTTRSGILSRLNCASFSKRLKFSAARGPWGPKVLDVLSCVMGEPLAAVRVVVFVWVGFFISIFLFAFWAWLAFLLFVF